MSSHDASQDAWTHRIRRVEIATGETTTLAGSGSAGFGDGASGSAMFNMPTCVAIDPSGAFALVVVRRPQPCTPASRHPAEGSTPALHTAWTGRTGFDHTLRGQTFSLALSQHVLP